MILSFHPCFSGDGNIICAGRPPAHGDIEEIQKADAVILPQGCAGDLYAASVENCAHVFPNYAIRFSHPGKTGQAKLFEAMGAPRPATLTFPSMHNLKETFPDFREPVWKLPFVFKFDWGGEGRNVFLIGNKADWETVLDKASSFEKTGDCGFLIQEYIPEAASETLRAVVLEKDVRLYMRVQREPGTFGTSVSGGADIVHDLDPEIERSARDAVKSLCGKTGINLAGFDLAFPNKGRPLFLEINWFFGRRGLGGSENFYRLFGEAVRRWLVGLKETK